MFKYDYKYAFLHDKLRNGEDLISFKNLDTLYSGGGVNHPFRRTFSSLIYHIHVYNFFILPYCRLSLHTCNL